MRGSARYASSGLMRGSARYAASGLMLGVAWGVAAGAWMPLLATDPHSPCGARSPPSCASSVPLPTRSSAVRPLAARARAAA